MRTLRISLLLFLLLTGCFKDKVPVPPPVSYPILHQEFLPIESFSCVDTLIQHPSGCGIIVQPSDSLVTRTIDLDADGQADFEISCSSWYHFLSASYPCVNYNTSYMISAQQSGAAIATIGNYNEIKKYVESDSIRPTDQWRTSAALLLAVTQAPFVTNFNGLSYFGLKLSKANGEWFGWLKLSKDNFNLTLLATGVKLGPSSGIQAGQVQ